MKSFLMKFSKRTSILAVLGLLVVAGSALAYFTIGTSTGTGGDTNSAATVTNPTAAWVISSQQSNPGPLNPGDSDNLTIYVKNSSSQPLMLNTVAVSDTAQQTMHWSGYFNAADFMIMPPSAYELLDSGANALVGITLPYAVPAGDYVQATGASLTLNNDSGAQDGEQGANVALAYSAS